MEFSDRAGEIALSLREDFPSFVGSDFRITEREEFARNIDRISSVLVLDRSCGDIYRYISGSEVLERFRDGIFAATTLDVLDLDCLHIFYIPYHGVWF